jgi:beta-galactosidase
LAGSLPETRVGWLEHLVPVGAAEPLFSDVDGRTCGVAVEGASGRAVVLTAELPADPALFTALLGWLGSPPALRLRNTVPGVVVTTGARPSGGRMVHVLNPTGYAATVQVDVGDPTGVLDRPLLLPARTGRMLALGLELPGGGTIVSSNAEVAELSHHRIRFAPGLGERTEVWLRTERTVRSRDTRIEGDLTLVSGPAGQDLVVELT